MHLSFEYDSTYLPAFPVMELTLSGARGQQVITGLIDSGSDVTQIPASVLRTIGAREIDERWIRDLSGVRYPVVIYAVQLQIGSLTLSSMEIVGQERTNEVIVGRDVLNQLLITLNGLAHITEVRD